MVGEIRIYVEGGGNKDGKAAMRRGMGQFLEPLSKEARSRKISWKVIACWSREDTHDIFQTACQKHPQAFNILLVDAERPVSDSTRAHLQAHDRWTLEDIGTDACHLMVQVMESWLIADPETLTDFFGHGFREGALPGGPDVEKVTKSSVIKGLEQATRDSRKGKYHKILHGPKILAKLDTVKVRNRAHHCERLFETLETKIRADR